MEAQAGESIMQLNKGYLVIRLQLQGSPDLLLQGLYLCLLCLQLWAHHPCSAMTLPGQHAVLFEGRH